MESGAKSISYGGDLFGKSWPFVMVASYRWLAGQGGIDFAVFPSKRGRKKGSVWNADKFVPLDSRDISE